MFCVCKRNCPAPFEDAAPDIVEYVRYLEVIAGKSANTAFSYYCDLRSFSRFMKRRRGLVATDAEFKEIDPKGLDTAFWGNITKEDIYEYLYFLNRECGNKKSSTARRLASLHGFYDYLVNQVNRLDADPTAAIHPPKQDKVLPKYLTAEQSMELLESTQTQSDFPERDYCMVTLFLNCGMRLAELVGMNLDDIDLENRQIRLFGKGHKERMVYLNDACMEALRLYLGKRNTMEGLLPQEKAVFITRRRKERISNRRVEQLVTGAMKAAGLKGFSTHKLRHTAATLMWTSLHSSSFWATATCLPHKFIRTYRNFRCARLLKKTRWARSKSPKHLLASWIQQKRKQGRQQRIQLWMRNFRLCP